MSTIMENRALLAALELSMLNLNNTTYSTASPDPPNGLFDESPDSPLSGSSKKSQNITQCVSVPTSEHVAEIVGRQGCKIKALRAKTNTYIKTPVRGEDPIFIITGRPEDVSVAKKEILHAADHFSQIRASRRSSSISPPNVGSTLNNGGVSNSSNSTEEKVTIFVRVPYRVVGLVVGPKGATVKRIQQSTGTYIVTPSRDMEPYFEVRGSPENVEQARKEIESYIVLRTGGAADQIGSPSGLVHCTESVGGGEGRVGNGNGTAKRIVRRTMSVSETPSLLLPGSMVPSSSTPTTVSENIGRKVEHRTSPLSSAVFSSGSSSQPTYEDNDILHPIPMSAPAMAFNKVFDFGSNKLQHYTATTTPTPTTTNWNGSWSPQPTTPLTNGSWGTLSYNSKASPQPPSPTGSWGSSGGKLSPQPPSPTGSWGSNSSEGLAVTSPRPFSSSGLSSLQGGYSQFPRASSMQQLRKMNRQNSFTPIIPAGICCCCEQNEADTILIPCGHKTTCFDCACRMSTYSAICPHCNSKIDSLAQQLSA